MTEHEKLIATTIELGFWYAHDINRWNGFKYSEWGKNDRYVLNFKSDNGTVEVFTSENKDEFSAICCSIRKMKNEGEMLCSVDILEMYRKELKSGIEARAIQDLKVQELREKKVRREAAKKLKLEKLRNQQAA